MIKLMNEKRQVGTVKEVNGMYNLRKTNGVLICSFMIKDSLIKYAIKRHLTLA